jgi:uncharacterized membrane protein YeiH
MFFSTHPASARFRTPVLILDGAGLAFFAVSGALKALTFGLTPVAAIMLGVLTGVGGGIARDVLVAEIPTVLRAELYAVAALAGASVVVIGNMLQLPRQGLGGWPKCLVSCEAASISSRPIANAVVHLWHSRLPIG